MDKIRVLVADDHATFRDSLCSFINDETDMTVVGTAGNGQEAVKLAVELKPDVVLMDVAMPDVNGIEATKDIAYMCSGTSVVMLSAFSSDAHLIGAIKAGAKGYLVKTAEVSDIVGAIRLVKAGRSILDNGALRHIVHHLEDKESDKNLTGRELNILGLLADGLSNREIAKALSLNPRSIQSYLTSIYRKLEVHSRTEAVLEAMREGWLKVKCSEPILGSLHRTDFRDRI